MTDRRRVLILGLDGATWTVLDPWVGDGSLPNLAALRARGVWGPLESTIPPLTPPAWTSFLTGKNPGRHGVFHFAVPDERTVDLAAGTPTIVDGRSIRSATLWDILGHHGRRLVTINVPMSYPPRPVNGVMVTCLLTPPDAPTFTYPPELSALLVDYQIDLDRFIGDKPFARDGQGPRPKRVIEPSVELVAEFEAMEERRARTALDLMRAEPWEVFTVVFSAPDRMGHYLWPYHRSDDLDGSPQASAIHEAIARFYRRLDEWIGELVAEAGPDVDIVVLSDHGMGPAFRRIVHWNAWLYRRGLVALEAATARRSLDGWLLRFGLPRDRLGRLVRRLPGLGRSRAVEALRRAPTARIDLVRSHAYFVRIFDPVGGIRVNAEGPERERLIGELLEALPSVVDPATGRPIVRRAARREECFDGPYAGLMPDVIVVMDEAYGTSDRVAAYSATVTDRPAVDDPGTHRIDGVLVLAGPDVAARPEPVVGPRIVDVAPTVLHLLGLPIPDDMDGRVLVELLAPPARDRDPVRSAPLPRWPSEEEAVPLDERGEAGETDEVRERLRSLGYVE
ncbi:MAG TPA: alkaline phosphatase family protein [Candidatus Limnocylindrales bacterium]|nr:alkaline phosphatase family protein [Candidatus Limnocylindrales bacterium]